MSGVSVLPAVGLLVLTVFCARPAGSGTVRRLLLAQAVLLALTLLALALTGRVPMANALLGIGFAGGECVVLWLRAGRWRESAEPAGVWPIALALGAAWIGFRLLPTGSMADDGSVASAALGVVLAGMVALVFARSDRSRWAALLSAGRGALLLVALSPRCDWVAWLMVLLPQALFLQRFCSRPVWSELAGADEA
ncbi:hypothetical protein NFI95_09810 [Acetobacteraceae bacterium KSS8]|uniref:Uncharacterized protein n=1 Tax=Endosaccharibacter trunci TaxID=2812733 RepID=A0ABT1W935_9PROT|nr:hypothetical protein [Acetobacteraceae bacterium KSS8]